MGSRKNFGIRTCGAQAPGSKPEGFSNSGPSVRRTRRPVASVNRLTKKGFHAAMSGHIKLTFRYNGRDTAIRTWVSHGKKEMRDRLLSIMAEQLDLSRQQFDDLVDCRLDGQGLAALYEESGLL